MEYEDLERHDLLSGEPRYVEDEVRNANFAMIFGGLGLVFCLVAMILTWILYSREKTRTFLWHAILLIFALLSAGLCAAWGAGTGTAIRKGRAPGNFMTGLVFILAIGWAVYLFVESLWLIMYKPVHFNYLVGLKSDKDLWEQRMVNGSSFEEGWTQSNRLLWWTIFFTIGAGLCFAFCAYAARSVVWNRYQLSRLALYLALAVIVFSAWMVIYWVEEGYEYRKAAPDAISLTTLNILKTIAIIAIVVAVINGIVNFVQSKPGYFVCAALEIGLLVFFVCAAGLLLRQVRERQLSDIFGNDCTSTMATIHEKDISSWCVTGGKYLADGQTCSKNFTTTYWEGDNRVRSLNPACCGIAKFFYLYPFMLIGFWSIILAACLGICIACNIYIADSNEYLTMANSSAGVIDYIGLALIFLTLIVWGIYMLARRANQLTNPTNSLAGSYNDPLNNPVDKFDIVPTSIKSQANGAAASPISTDNCYKYDFTNNPVPRFSSDSSKTSCTNSADCYQRVALLVSHATVKLAPPSVNGDNAIQGSVNNRGNFFPGCTANNNDYMFYYGNTSQIAKLFEGMRVCPTSGSVNPSILIYQDQVQRKDVQAGGLLANENTNPTVLTTSNSSNCANGFEAYRGDSSNPCTGPCKLTFTPADDTSYYTLKGKLFFLENNVASGNIHNRVAVEAYARGNRVGGNYTLLENGLFLISNVPKYNSSAYVLQLVVKDPVGVYQEKAVDILIDKDQGGTTDLSAGSIRLTTRDAKRCNETNNGCIVGQQLQNGNINLVVQNSSEAVVGSSFAPAANVAVKVLRGFTLGGAQVAQGTTDSQGRVSIKNLPYGSYMVIASGESVRDNSVQIDLQETNNNPRAIVLSPTQDKNDMRVIAVMGEPNADFDLLVQMRSDKGGQCTVSSINKYCPYAAHINDVKFGTGEEQVIVKKLAVANYLAYVQPAPAYSSSCAYANDYEANLRKYHYEAWNWNSFKTTNPLNTLRIFTSTYGNKFSTVLDKFGQSIYLLKVPESVETYSESDKPHKVIAINGTPITYELIIKTIFGRVTNKTNPNSGFVYPNTTSQTNSSSQTNSTAQNN